MPFRVASALARLRVRIICRSSGFGQLDIEDLALADRRNTGEAEGSQGTLDGLTLRVEDAGFQGDRNACLHPLSPK